jgi:hypothetical protein
VTIGTTITALQAATEYVQRGWQVVPVPFGRKGPILNSWQKLRLAEADLPVHFKAASNIGVLLGEPSGGLVDVDADCPEAVAALDSFLPATPMVHGRSGNPRSHWWYLATPVPNSRQYEDTDGSKVLEVRSTGMQTLVPPSLHPSGEQYVWTGVQTPATITGDDLLRATAATAVCALMARHWPGCGSRHKAALAWAGLLLRNGVPETDAQLLIESAARIAGDGEWRDRRAAISSTVARVADGRPVSGGPTLADLLGPDAARLVEKVLHWLGVRDDAPRLVTRGKPVLDAGNVDLEAATPLASSALARRNDPPSLFQYGDAPVRVSPTTTEPAKLEPVGRLQLKYELARAACWFRTKKGQREPALPPSHIVSDLLGAPTFGWPFLRRLTAIPSLTAAGRLLTAPGYDASSQLYYAPASELPISVPASPTRQDIDAAVALLRDDLLRDFPFADESDRAHAVSCLLLGFVRDHIVGPTPLHIIEKPTPGTGATLLLEVVTRILTGRSAPLMTEASTDEEFRKRITARLVESPDVFAIDNVRGKLQSGALAAAVTSSMWSDRILGLSRTIQIPVHCTWIVTANNPTLSEEIARRAVRIRMDAKVDRPWLRTGFLHPDLRAFVTDNRAKLVSAALTLCRAWFDAGTPAGHASLGMFENWARVIGGILQVAGVPGFLENSDALYETADVEGQEIRALLGRWWEVHRGNPVGVAEIFGLVNPAIGDALDLALGDGGERSQRTRLGKRLNQIRDRQYGPYRLEKAGTRQGAQLWRLRQDSETPSANTTTAAAQRVPSSLCEIAPSFADATAPVENGFSDGASPSCAPADRLAQARSEPPVTGGSCDA